MCISDILGMAPYEPITIIQHLYCYILTHSSFYSKIVIQSIHAILFIVQSLFHFYKGVLYMKKTTQELEVILTSGVNISEYYETYKEEFLSVSLTDYLENLLEKKHLKKADVIKKSGMDRTYGYQIFNGTRKPSRNSLLSLGIGMELSLNEIQQLLKVASFAPLYARNKRDSAIIYGFEHHLNNIDMNELLLQYDYECLQTNL